MKFADDRPGSAQAAVQEPPPQAALAGLQVQTGVDASCQRVVIYGPPGIGKSSLAGGSPKSLMLDVDDGARLLGIPRVSGFTEFQQVIDALHSPDIAGYESVVVDSISRVEDLAAAHVIDRVPVDTHGTPATSMESYGFGKGYTFLYEEFLRFIAALDALRRKGVHVILVAHECVVTVPHPGGVDFLRYEPKLSSPKSGRASIRALVQSWADHVLYIGYDIAPSAHDERKAIGSGTRTIYTQELPTFLAKSRSLRGDRPYVEGDVSLWADLFHSPPQE